LGRQNDYWNIQIARIKTFCSIKKSISVIIISVLRYFDESTKLSSHLYSTKFLDISAKPFFSYNFLTNRKI